MTNPTTKKFKGASLIVLMKFLVGCSESAPNKPDNKEIYREILTIRDNLRNRDIIRNAGISYSP